MAGFIYHFAELSGNLRDHLVTLCPPRDGKEARRGQGPQPRLTRPHRESQGQAPGPLAPRPSSSRCTTLPTLGPAGLPTDLVPDEMFDSVCFEMYAIGVS